jgi:diguanylate cyclase (GGDEF)-like protein
VPSDPSPGFSPGREIARLCMHNLLANPDQRLFFKDREGRFLVVSAGWLAAEGQGRSPHEVIGKTDFDIFSRPHALAGFADEQRVLETGEPMVTKAETETFDDRPDACVSTTKLPLRDERGDIIGTWGITRDVTAEMAAERAMRRHAEGQAEIAGLGRLALKAQSLQDLFDHAVRSVSRVLSADCAWLVERLPDPSEFVIRAAIGWTDERKHELIPAEASSLSGYAVRSRGPIVVEDWEQERRFRRSGKLAALGVRSSVAVLVGDSDAPFGILAAHYTKTRAAPADGLAFLDVLANVLAEAIASRDAQETNRQQALHDGLTGLPNRTLFLDRVAHALARSNRRRGRLAVFFVDLAAFKLVNDSVGHARGDELLRLVAARLAGAIGQGDTLAALGGDEFAVLCEELASEVAATRIAHALLTALEEPVVLGGDQHTVSASIGIALSTGESSATEMLRDADAALHHAKRAGRGRFELFDVEMRARVLSRVRTESALRAALADEEQIYVHYQPLVSLGTNRIVGAEALVRWRHPDRGAVLPLDFIPVAEDSGLIHELGAKVINRAARECAGWQDTPDFAGVAINVSTRQLVQPDEVPRLVSRVITTEDLRPGFLTLEITESTLIEQLESAQAVLRSLKNLGVRLSLDDFGTGYSSLSYLRDLPFDSVKIDYSLIRHIVDFPHAAELASAIIQMGHALDLQVIAEGVETAEQVTRLRTLGCDVAQGFYFAQPMGPEQLTAVLRDQPN